MNDGMFTTCLRTLQRKTAIDYSVSERENTEAIDSSSFIEKTKTVPKFPFSLFEELIQALRPINGT